MAYNIEELKKQYGYAQPTATPNAGNSSDYDIEALKRQYGYVTQSTPIAEQPKESFIASTKPSFPASMGGATSIPKNIVKTAANIPSSARNLVRSSIAPVNPFDRQSPLNIGENIVQGAKDITALTKGVKDIGVGGTLKALAGGVGDVAKKGLDIYKGVGEKIYGNLEQNVLGRNSVVGGIGVSTGQGLSKVAETAIEDPLLIPSMIYAPSKVKGTGVTTDVISNVSKPIVTKAEVILPKAKAIFEPTTKALEAKVIKEFEKGVKPLLNARSTPAQVAKYKNNIVEATKVINENKPNLSFVDDAGETIIGQNPQSLKQLSEAVDQTKKNIYTEYNNLAKQSGEKGLTIKTNPIADELDSVIANEALQITNPSAVQYARDLKDRLSYRELTPEITEEVIKNYNKALDAFFKNPTYDTATKASIDAFIVNKFREQLDNGINSLTGENYQVLKNKYSSLKTVENDVLKAALRDARKNNKGLIDFTDIFSGSDILSGILSLNPAQFTRGVAGRGIKEYYKYLNSPNRAVKKMFNTTEKLNQRLPKSRDVKSSTIVPENNQLQTLPSINIPTAPNNIAIPTTLPPKKKFVNKQGGFVINPLVRNVKIKDAELGEMRDFLDIQAGSYKPEPKLVIKNEADVRAMVEARFGKEVANLSTAKLKNYVNKIVDKYWK